MKKYYFKPGCEQDACYTIDAIKEDMAEDGISEIEVTEAVIQRIGGMFWCNEYDSVCDVGECGKHCDAYKPRNKIKGICIHHSNFHEEGNKKITIKL
jgi:hypothetical protein